jgi:hypothetical protein
MSHAISLERLGIGSRMPSYARMDLLPCACKNATSISPLPHKPATRNSARAAKRSGTNDVKAGVSSGGTCL